MSAHKKFGGIFLKLVFQEARKQCSWQLITMVLITLVFAWEAYDKGCEVHLQADPTKLELLYESFKVKKEDFKEQQKESILEKVIMTKRHTIRFNPSGLGAIGIQYQYNYISELLQQNKPPQT